MLNKPITFARKSEFIPVDSWIPNPEDLIFKHTKGAVILPVSNYYNSTNTDLDYFITSPKRCYNTPKMREHLTHYLNYFEKFYDEDKELLSIYFTIKYLIDVEKAYNSDAFIYDIKRYLLSPSMMFKIKNMNRENYSLNLKFEKEENLRYTDKHGIILMQISLIMLCIIPLATHFISMKYKGNIDGFLLTIYDMVLDMFDVNIYNKLYETSSSNINKNTRYNPIWEKQDIRGINTTTLSIGSVQNMLVNIMPKYVYNQNIVCYNFKSVVKTIRFQVTGIEYDEDYIPLSSSKRDFEQNSEFDKFESYLSKSDESLYLQNKVNCQETMKFIEASFGPFDQDEIKYYITKLSDNNNIIINSFQKNLVFNLFYKYFGDVMSIKAINKEDYVKLVISAKKILQSNNMVILPYIISSKITRLVTRKNVNNKEKQKIQLSPLYNMIIQKYKSEKIVNDILSIISTILSSEFKIIDFYDNDLDGKPIESFPADIIAEEVLMYVSLI